MRMLFWKISLWFCVILGLCGCETIGYYSQAVSGHIGIMRRAESIERLLAADELSDALRNDLIFVQQVRDFASEHLLLPNNASYRSYADLQRPYVVWNIVAAPEFSLTPKRWCFLFAGCLSYRGYFSEEKARAFADDLQKQGYEIYLYGVSAYSTLGWFDDPMLNTMLMRDRLRIAEVIFHELTHQKTYIKDDSEFNEAFATTVQQLGVERWLSLHGSENEIQQFQQRLHRQTGFLQLVNSAKAQLEKLYEKKSTPEDLRFQKQEILSQLRNDYAVLKLSWNGYAGYDAWFADLNNAKFAGISTYYKWVPFFRHLFDQHEQDFAKFYLAVEKVAAQPKAERQALWKK